MDTQNYPHELKIQLRDILIKHDVDGFREFMELHNSNLYRNVIEDMTDDRLSFFMHEYKSVNMSYGPEWQQSRNAVRIKTIYDGNPPEDLKLCRECRWFRDKPSVEEMSCMHLGSTPDDVICKAFEAVPEGAQNSSISVISK